MSKYRYDSREEDSSEERNSDILENGQFKFEQDMKKRYEECKVFNLVAQVPLT